MRITWSYRKRGSDQRTHIMKKSIAAIFTMKAATESAEETHPQDAGHSQPGRGFHPPRKSATKSAEPAAMCPYSPTKNRPNLKEPYSVW